MSNFLIYKASAGSGKTYNLAVQYIRQLLSATAGQAHRHILAVTFTKDATSEMKARIIAELYGLAMRLPESAGFMHALREQSDEKLSDEETSLRARHALSAILHDYSRFHVATIDSFFQQVLRNLARELGKGSRFNIEMNTVKAVDDAVTALLERSNTDAELLGWITDYLKEKLALGNSWRIDKDLKRFGQHIFNETFQAHEPEFRRQNAEQPHQIRDAIRQCRRIRRTFEEEMKRFAGRFFQILEGNGISGNMFAGGSVAKAGHIVSYFKKIEAGAFLPDIRNLTVEKCLDDPQAWVAKNKPDREAIIAVVTTHLQPLLIETETFRNNRLAEYTSAKLLLKNIHQLALLEYISEELDTQNRENNRFMLSHTAMLLNRMIDRQRDAAFIYEKIDAEIAHVMIDEFQDTSHLQWENFRALLAEMIASNNFSLLVGDVKQSIYRWRNSDWRILNNIEQELPHFEQRFLNVNYRSAKRVVTFNNTLFSTMSELLARAFEEHNGVTDGNNPFRKAYADVAQTPANSLEAGYVSVDFCKADKESGISYADAVMETLIERLKELYAAGVQAADVCILCRKNSSLRAIADRLAACRQSHPEMAAAHYFDVVSADAFQMASSVALQIIVSALRAVAAPDNIVPRAEVCLLWQRTFAAGAEQMPAMHATAMDALLPEGFHDLQRLAVMPLYELVIELYHLFSLQRVSGQAAYLYAFMDGLTAYLQQHPSDITAFVEYWDEELSLQPVATDTAPSGIRAMTIHKAKGLQFHTVIVPFCDWGMADKSSPMRENLVWCMPSVPPFDLAILPIDYSREMAYSCFEAEFRQETALLWMDNLNVLYVALTRAGQNLMILAKQPAKAPKNLHIADMIYAALPDANGEEVFRTGTIVPSQTEKKAGATGFFKSGQMNSVTVHFPMSMPEREGTAFLPSNQAKLFVQGEQESLRAHYIQQGNVFHALFAAINTLNDIPEAVEALARQGVIAGDTREKYRCQMTDMITSSHVETWFSGKYQLFNECQILTRTAENRLLVRRPDRVMTSPDETIVIDYKFGTPHAAHREQVAEYVRLIRQMGFPAVKGYIWYVTANEVVGC
ncbi:MAG: UvrD-helicase domain-containing protein [Prevotellaceae bacterium]|jgi:ATP-dependent exoDNAse (exonuclease V) beta subunit|nr:UvrD-helicase domain-containing protein [Prevotellaceae bacterium]